MNFNDRFLINLKSILHNKSDLKSAKIFNIKSKIGEMPPAENTNKYDKKNQISIDLWNRIGYFFVGGSC